MRHHIHVRFFYQASFLPDWVRLDSALDHSLNGLDLTEDHIRELHSYFGY
jgi:hypothetical protein